MTNLENTLVHTPLGDIVAIPSPDQNYPGAYLAIRRGDRTVGLALIEVDNTEEDNPELCVHVWSAEDPWGDVLFSVRSSKETADGMFEGDDA